MTWWPGMASSTFAANDGTSPLTSQLWTSGGTAATTSKVASFPRGHHGSCRQSTRCSAHIDAGFRVPAAARRRRPRHRPVGDRRDRGRGRSSWPPSIPPTSPCSMAPLIFLGTGGGSPFGLWKTDGTAGGTTEVKDLSQYGAGPGTTVTPGRLAASGASSTSPRATAGRRGPLGQRRHGRRHEPRQGLHAAHGQTGYRGPSRDMTPFAGKLAFVADAGTLGPQVWISDGTSGGTQMLTDLANAARRQRGPGDPRLLDRRGRAALLHSRAPGGHRVSAGLWSSDGHAGRHVRVLPFPTLPTSNPLQPIAIPTAADLTVVGSDLFFSLQYSYPERPNYVE